MVKRLRVIARSEHRVRQKLYQFWIGNQRADRDEVGDEKWRDAAQGVLERNVGSNHVIAEILDARGSGVDVARPRRRLEPGRTHRAEWPGARRRRDSCAVENVVETICNITETDDAQEGLATYTRKAQAALVRPAPRRVNSAALVLLSRAIQLFLLLLPGAHLLLRFILGDAVGFLDLACKLLAFACDDVKLVVGELAPLLLDVALHLLPVAFYAIPVHRGFLLVKTRFLPSTIKADAQRC
jgi:hypothetical protein